MVRWFMPVHLLSLPNWRGSGLVVVEHLTPFNFATANPKNFLFSNCRRFQDHQSQCGLLRPNLLLPLERIKFLHRLSPAAICSAGSRR